MTGWAVRVNECKVFATAAGAAWWATWRHRMERAGRITVITASMGGDLVDAACDSREDAASLAAHMVEFAGMPKSALRVVRS